MSAKMNPKVAKVLPFVLLAAAAVIWFLAVSPLDDAMRAVRAEIAGLSGEVREMGQGVQELEKLEGDLAVCASNRAAHADCVIEPLLGSVAMRAKTLLDPIAAETGIEDVRYEDAAPGQLPPTATVPKVPYVRARVRVQANASYMALVSFLSRVERLVPGACVVFANISAGGRDVEIQSGEFVLEWLSEPTEKEVGGAAR